MLITYKEKIFIQSYNEYWNAIFCYCYYRVSDKEKTKDFVQETYYRTWKYLHKGNKIKNIRAFLYKTAHHIIIDYYRKKKSFSLDQMMEKGFCPSISPKEQHENYFISKDVLNIVKSLDKKYTDVIIMKYIQDLSTKEISLALNKSENSIYVNISRGFAKVKEIFLNDPGQLKQSIISKGRI